MLSMARKTFATAALLMAAVGLAFAEMKNPFAEVHLGDWTYDALAQLEPLAGTAYREDDGRPMTRFDMASVVARLLWLNYREDLGEQDSGTLKRLVVEFEVELNALGVPTDDPEHWKKRIEERLRNWPVSNSPPRITVEMLSGDVERPRQ